MSWPVMVSLKARLGMVGAPGAFGNVSLTGNVSAIPRPATGAWTGLGRVSLAICVPMPGALGNVSLEIKVLAGVGGEGGTGLGILTVSWIASCGMVSLGGTASRIVSLGPGGLGGFIGSGVGILGATGLASSTLRPRALCTSERFLATAPDSVTKRSRTGARTL